MPRNLLKETVDAMAVNPIHTSDDGAALAVMGVIYCAVYHGNPEAEPARTVYNTVLFLAGDRDEEREDVREN